MREASKSNVIQLPQRGEGRPDFASLARNQVASARRKLDLSPEQFAELIAPMLGWSPSGQVVESWETVAVPPGDVILAAGVAAQTISPEILTAAMSSKAERIFDLLTTIIGDVERVSGSPDVVRTLSMRGLISRPEWNAIIRGSTKHLWLYGMAELGYASDDEVPHILRAAREAGCDVRVLLLSPAYSGLTEIDECEGSPAGTLNARIRAALARFARIEAKGTHIDIHTYNRPPTVSIVRGDDRMYVTPYLQFFVGSNSPTLELIRAEDGGMFDRFSRHFNNMWELSKGWAE